MIFIVWRNSQIENDDFSKIKWIINSKKKKVYDSYVKNNLDTEGDDHINS
jgi:hypothetical protein